MVRRTFGLGLLAVAAACSDAPTAVAPSPTAAAAKDIEFARVLATQSFDIVPGQTTLVNIDGNYIYVQADALCAAGSGYGRQYFDLACARETSRVTVFATLGIDLSGNPLLSFSRDVRFSPDKVAYVFLKADKSALKGAAIKWYDAAQLAWVDEGAYDRDQKTYWSKDGKMLWRRLKHFSGYNVGAGENCDPLVDPTCTVDPITLGN